MRVRECGARFRETQKRAKNIPPLATYQIHLKNIGFAIAKVSSDIFVMTMIRTLKFRTIKSNGLINQHSAHDRQIILI